MTLNDIFDLMNQDQKDLCHIMVAEAYQEGFSKGVEHSEKAQKQIVTLDEMLQILTTR